MAGKTIEAVIEIPKGSRNKYEFDHDRHVMRLDRRLFTATVYPADYGFIPDTLAEDGDPLDVLVILAEPTFPGCYIQARPLGVFWMRDENGPDAKVISVVAGDPDYENVREVTDLPKHFRDEIEHFFNVYKDLEPGKSTLTAGFEGADAAWKVIDDAAHRWKAADEGLSRGTGFRQQLMVSQAEFDQLLDLLRAFVRREVMPAEADIDASDEIPARLIAQAKEMGLYGYALPTDYGGLGLSVEQQVRVGIELGYTSPAFRSLFGTNNGIAGQVLVLAGTEEQRKQWLPRLASGEVVASFALTEPDAGSDPSRLVTTASQVKGDGPGGTGGGSPPGTREVGGGWVIDGLKRYITNAPAADVFMVFARTDPQAPPGKGIGVFLVPARTDGVAVAARDHKMGQAGAWTADVAFTGVRVPADALIGEAPQAGYATAMRSLAHGRLTIAAVCVGVAARLIDESVAYAKQRYQGGQRIGDYQLVQAMLADSHTEYLAARALVLDAAARYDDGTDRRLGPSAAKYFASEAVGRIADRAVQIHGGSGYIRGIPVERLYRDVRLFRIYEGTSQIQQLVIARELLR
jgi:acyl-CoA dehydrogenase